MKNGEVPSWICWTGRSTLGNPENTSIRKEIEPYRGCGENETYNYTALAYAFEKVFYPNYPDISAPIQRVYEEVYKKPLYEQLKTPEKPINTKTDTVSKKKEEKPKKKEEKTPEKPINTKCEDDSEQIPGQTELVKDFPEYVPEEMKKKPDGKKPDVTVIDEQHSQEESVADKGREEEPEEAANPYKNRYQYMQELTMEEFSEYMANAMHENKTITFQSLLKESYWKNWLEQLVDEEGRTIQEG